MTAKTKWMGTSHPQLPQALLLLFRFQHHTETGFGCEHDYFEVSRRIESTNSCRPGVGTPPNPKGGTVFVWEGKRLFTRALWLKQQTSVFAGGSNHFCQEKVSYAQAPVCVACCSEFQTVFHVWVLAQLGCPARRHLVRDMLLPSTFKLSNWDTCDTSPWHGEWWRIQAKMVSLNNVPR